MSKTSPHHYRRRTYLIDRKFQIRFMLKFCAIVFFGSLLTIGLLYWMSSQSATVSIVNSRVTVCTTSKFLLPLLVQTVLIVTVLVSIATVIVTLFVSHKIAGPLYHFKRTIGELAEGDFSSDFNIRGQDQLQALAQSFNTMINKVRTQINIAKSHTASLRAKLGSLSEHEIAESKKAVLSELKHITQELEGAIHHFKS